MQLAFESAQRTRKTKMAKKTEFAIVQVASYIATVLTMAL